MESVASYNYFWRDSNGNEVDVLIEAGEQLPPVLVYGGNDSYKQRMTVVMGWRKAGEGVAVKC